MWMAVTKYACLFSSLKQRFHQLEYMNVAHLKIHFSGIGFGTTDGSASTCAEGGKREFTGRRVWVLDIIHFLVYVAVVMI